MGLLPNLIKREATTTPIIVPKSLWAHDKYFDNGQASSQSELFLVPSSHDQYETTSQK